MPFVSKLKHRKPFNPRIDLKQRLLDVVIILEAIRPLNILPSAKREMLDRAFWLVAELSGDFSPRYRSDDVLCKLGSKIQRDHIFPRASLIAAILEGTEPLHDIISRAVCCLVTKDEHHRLKIAPPEAVGWDRYKTVDIVVRDMSTYRYADEEA